MKSARINMKKWNAQIIKAQVLAEMAVQEFANTKLLQSKINLKNTKAFK